MGPSPRARATPSSHPVEVSTDKSRLDRDLIFQFLHDEAYWCRGIDRERVEQAIARSLCFGAYDGSSQVGFARVVTDAATFAYLCDVFVVPGARGRGVGKRLIEAALAHSDLQGLRRVILATDDAHGLYQQFGFAALRRPEIFMAIEKSVQEAYAASSA